MAVIPPGAVAEHSHTEFKLGLETDSATGISINDQNRHLTDRFDTVNSINHTYTTSDNQTIMNSATIQMYPNTETTPTDGRRMNAALSALTQYSSRSPIFEEGMALTVSRDATTIAEITDNGVHTNIIAVNIEETDHNATVDITATATRINSNPVCSLITSTVEPGSGSVGQLWFNPNTGQLSIYTE